MNDVQTTYNQFSWKEMKILSCMVSAIKRYNGMENREKKHKLLLLLFMCHNEGYGARFSHLFMFNSMSMLYRCWWINFLKTFLHFRNDKNENSLNELFVQLFYTRHTIYNTLYYLYSVATSDDSWFIFHFLHLLNILLNDYTIK